MVVLARWLAVALLAAAGLVGGLSAQTRTPVWIDTDPALGEPDRDVDDGLALVQAFRLPALDIRGVSVVFGNAPLDRGVPIARRVLDALGQDRMPVAAGAAEAGDLGRETEASRALARALAAEPLTILALGPATNVATVIRLHPDLARRMTRVVAVAGRRPGQRFTTGTTNARGHRDFNFELDPESFRVILEAGVPLVLAPFEISSAVWLDDTDLARLAAGPPATRMLVDPSRAWLALWRRLWGVSGFNPFDTLAVGYVGRPDGFVCESLPVDIRVLPDDVTEPGVQGTVVAEKP
ncbi:MAG: nucleoside hydrolase, partial [Acidobacteriota bacterium]|nr:nucleoside hydrolase [Acidobacteriota bacterium]